MTSKTTIAELVYTSDQITLRVPYNAGLIAAIKRLIPKRARSWSPEDKCWIISRSYEAELLEILSSFPNAVRVKREWNEQQAMASQQWAIPQPTTLGQLLADQLLADAHAMWWASLSEDDRSRMLFAKYLVVTSQLSEWRS